MYFGNSSIAISRKPQWREFSADLAGMGKSSIQSDTDVEMRS
jgi:hypothetical protein